MRYFILHYYSRYAYVFFTADKPNALGAFKIYKHQIEKTIKSVGLIAEVNTMEGMMIRIGGWDLLSISDKDCGVIKQYSRPGTPA